MDSFYNRLIRFHFDNLKAWFNGSNRIGSKFIENKIFWKFYFFKVFWIIIKLKNLMCKIKIIRLKQKI